MTLFLWHMTRTLSPCSRSGRSASEGARDDGAVVAGAARVGARAGVLLAVFVGGVRAAGTTAGGATMTDLAAAAAAADGVEAAMRSVGMWQEAPLDPAAYEFTMAFAMDTMAFSQWLQFVFLPRVRELSRPGGRCPPRASRRAGRARVGWDGRHGRPRARRAPRLRRPLRLRPQNTVGMPRAGDRAQHDLVGAAADRGEAGFPEEPRVHVSSMYPMPPWN